ncbi:MAG: hypothetical protein J1F35_06060 [Erysipelotrichales bacterium]|nr:hypothetical protein [Erysipelotrichales bacterium]
MKSLIDIINEAKFKTISSIKAGDTIYAIVSDYDNKYSYNRLKRDMKPYKFTITEVRKARDGKGLYAKVEQNKFNIDRIYFTDDEIRDFACNGTGIMDMEYDEVYTMFCAKSIDELQELMDSEVGEEIGNKLNKISKLENDKQQIDKKIEQIKAEIDELKSSAQLEK